MNDDSTTPEPRPASHASRWVWASLGSFLLLFLAGALLRQVCGNAINPIVWLFLAVCLITASIGMVQAVAHRQWDVAAAAAIPLLLFGFVIVVSWLGNCRRDLFRVPQERLGQEAAPAAPKSHEGPLVQPKGE